MCARCIEDRLKIGISFGALRTHRSSLGAELMQKGFAMMRVAITRRSQGQDQHK
jgi:hypothetical protein